MSQIYNPSRPIGHIQALSKKVFSILILAVLLLPAAPCRAGQSDSIARASIHGVLSLDSRSTIIEGKHITINGILGGIAFGRGQHKLTLGYYWLSYGAKQRLIDLHKSHAHRINLEYYTRTDVGFASLAYWFPLYRNPRWTVYIPVETGLGSESANYRRISDDAQLGSGHFYFVPYQLGAYGEFKATPWVGFGLQIGYRNAARQTVFREHFEGPYYSYGLTFYPDRIYSDLKKYWAKRHTAR
ncbi:hypothetical protein [Dyadobacter sp.]|uniref:hypothetical protein n=1 Tax=Dyadobacter sp. TaxID=1914288 RepID=UPI003F6EFBBA